MANMVAKTSCTLILELTDCPPPSSNSTNVYFQMLTQTTVTYITT